MQTVRPWPQNPVASTFQCSALKGWSALETRTLSCRDFWRQDKVKQDKTRYLLISALVLVLSRDFVCLSYFSLSQLFLRQEKITKCSFSLSLFSATRKILIFQSVNVFVSIINSKCKMAAFNCRQLLHTMLYVISCPFLKKLKSWSYFVLNQSSILNPHTSLPPSQVDFSLFDKQ